MKKSLSTILLLLVMSCATPFSEPQYGYGVAATPLGGNVFRVQAQLNSWSSPNMVGDYLLLRAADVAGRNNAIGFVILDSRDTSTRSTYMAAPGQYSTTVVGCGAYSFTPCRVDTTYRPPVYYSDLYPGGMMTIRLVWQPENGWYDKNQIVATIGPQYGVTWQTPTSPPTPAVK